MPVKIECGVKEPKGNSRRGTMLECAAKKQIRYFGVKKIDKIILDKLIHKDIKKITFTLPEAIGKVAGLRTRIKRVEKTLEIAEKKGDEEKVAVYEKEIDQAKKELAKMIPIAKKLQAEHEKEEADKQKKKEKAEKKKEEERKKKEEKKKKDSKKKSKK